MHDCYFLTGKEEDAKFSFSPIFLGRAQKSGRKRKEFLDARMKYERNRRRILSLIKIHGRKQHKRLAHISKLCSVPPLFSLLRPKRLFLLLPLLLFSALAPRSEWVFGRLNCSLSKWRRRRKRGAKREIMQTETRGKNSHRLPYDAWYFCGGGACMRQLLFVCIAPRNEEVWEGGD